VLSRYADVSAALRNHAVFSSAQGIGSDRDETRMMISTDPPDHAVLRPLNLLQQPALIGGAPPHRGPTLPARRSPPHTDGDDDRHAHHAAILAASRKM
jgi:hypothetical protein